MAHALRRTRLLVAAVAALIVLSVGTRLRAADPIRVVLLVDSSTNMNQMLTEFRAGINAFLDDIPDDVEVALVSTGGQLRIRVQPTTDRQRLRQAASAFASDGGANAFLDTLLESDQRLLKSARDRRPVFVVMTTDQPSRGEPNVDQYNRFMQDFVRRRGHTHAVVIRGGQMGLASEILDNLTKNTDGLFDVLAVGNSLAARMRDIAAQVTALD
jgi:hypothetical protein